MFERTVAPKLQDLYNGPLGVRGNWMVACVRSQMAWPSVVTEVVFRGRTIFLIPWADAGGAVGLMYPAAAVRLDDGEDADAGQLLISHFLSSLAWAHGQSIEVDQWSGGNIPRSMGGFNGPYILARDFIHPYVPDPIDTKVRLALGFYREGLGLNNAAYACLSFFKVLNIFMNKGDDQIAWIAATIPKIKDHRAKSRISFLENSGLELGQYLYVTNRCAVAHAFGRTANPEDPADMRRMRQDLPVVRALAEYAIEYHFGVKSSRTIYNEHLYELEGFTQIFGTENVAAIKACGKLDLNIVQVLPRLKVTLAGSEGYSTLANLNSEIVSISDGHVDVRCTSDDGLTGIMIRLNFADERLQIDVNQGLVAGDDGSAGAARGCAVTLLFIRDYILNGILEVWDSGQQKLLGRCNAFIPTNIDLGATKKAYDEQIRGLQAKADLRSISEIAR